MLRSILFALLLLFSILVNAGTIEGVASLDVQNNSGEEFNYSVETLFDSCKDYKIKKDISGRVFINFPVIDHCMPKFNLKIYNDKHYLEYNIYGNSIQGFNMIRALSPLSKIPGNDFYDVEINTFNVQYGFTSAHIIINKLRGNVVSNNFLDKKDSITVKQYDRDIAYVPSQTTVAYNEAYGVNPDFYYYVGNYLHVTYRKNIHYKKDYLLFSSNVKDSYAFESWIGEEIKYWFNSVDGQQSYDGRGCGYDRGNVFCYIDTDGSNITGFNFGGNS